MDEQDLIRLCSATSLRTCDYVSARLIFLNLVTSLNMILYSNHNNMFSPMFRWPWFCHRILQFKFRNNTFNTQLTKAYTTITSLQSSLH